MIRYQPGKLIGGPHHGTDLPPDKIRRARLVVPGPNGDLEVYILRSWVVTGDPWVISYYAHEELSEAGAQAALLDHLLTGSQVVA